MIIFLDFDGPIFPDKVLNIEKNQGDFCKEMCEKLNIHPFYSYWYADSNIISFLNDLKLRYDYKLVLSTSWASDYMNTKEELIKILEHNGLLFTLHEDWRTPRVRSGRIEQIEDWLVKNNENDYIILDDIKSMPEIKSELNSIIKRESIFLADLYNGFNDKDFKEIENFFEKLLKSKNKKLKF